MTPIGQKVAQVWPLEETRSSIEIRGRVLDPDGKPLAGIVIDPHYQEDRGKGMHARLHEARPIASDANGAFILDSLIPELPFELSFRRGRRDFAREMKAAEAKIQVKPGETKNVGDLKMKPKE